MYKVGILLFVCAAVFVFLLTANSEQQPVLQNAWIANTALKIEYADTPKERMRGLSGRESLAENTGILFIFEVPGKYGFWMKDMNFPIDIAWLDPEMQIIHIESAVSPASYPNVFIPPSDSLYVLEVNSGFFSSHKIEIGQTLEIQVN